MKPFRFRLARLLRLKQAEHKQLASVLTQERRRLDEAESALEGAEAAQGRVAATCLGLAATVSCAADWIGAQGALVAARRRAGECALGVQQAEARVERARERLAAQSREVETYRRLREKKRLDHVLHERRAEQREIDASAVERFAQDAARSER